MDFLHQNIGSAKDNLKSPIHNWYKFTAGFSHKFVDEIIQFEKLGLLEDAKIFDPFAGCGTTLVSAQKNGILAVGNEAQELMYDVIRAKIGWDIKPSVVEYHIDRIRKLIISKISDYQIETFHPLIDSLYETDDAKKLYLIKEYINSIKAYKYKHFLRLALSQTLHKVAKHPIAVPYISRNKNLTNTNRSQEVYESVCQKMMEDLSKFSDLKKTSKIFLHDSRRKNKGISDNECTTCITSPPYLNNLDYGEVSKVHTHFFGLTHEWRDITNKVRKKLVTGSTTHYNDSEFSLNKYRKSEFYLKNLKVCETIIGLSNRIKEVSKERAGKKSFDILTLLYFKDMYEVLKEIRRVLSKQGKAYLILGDSAPYGVLIPTTELLGNVAKSVGFREFEIHKIRARGTKWKSLKYRHSIELTENVLILK